MKITKFYAQKFPNFYHLPYYRKFSNSDPKIFYHAVDMCAEMGAMGDFLRRPGNIGYKMGSLLEACSGEPDANRIR